MEVVREIGVRHGGGLRLVECVHGADDGSDVHEAVSCLNVGAIARLGHLNKRRVVQRCNDGIAVGIRFETSASAKPVVQWDGRARSAAHAHGVHFDASVKCVLCHGNRIVFVVFTIGKDNDHFGGR